MSRLLLAISLIVPTMLAGQRADPSANEAALALAIDREVLRVASSQSLWPGYQPASVPLAIYTGGRTYLFVILRRQPSSSRWAAWRRCLVGTRPSPRTAALTLAGSQARRCSPTAPALGSPCRSSPPLPCMRLSMSSSVRPTRAGRETRGISSRIRSTEPTCSASAVRRASTCGVPSRGHRIGHASRGKRWPGVRAASR